MRFRLLYEFRRLGYLEILGPAGINGMQLMYDMHYLISITSSY